MEIPMDNCEIHEKMFSVTKCLRSHFVWFDKALTLPRHCLEDQNDIPDPIGLRPIPFYFSGHIKTLTLMFSRISKCRNWAPQPLILFPAPPAQFIRFAAMRTKQAQYRSNMNLEHKDRHSSESQQNTKQSWCASSILNLKLSSTWVTFSTQMVYFFNETFIFEKSICDPLLPLNQTSFG